MVRKGNGEDVNEEPMPVGIREGEILEDLQRNGLKIIQKRRGFRFCTDSVLLADFCAAKPGERVADMGTGSGVIPLLIAARTGCVCIHGFELQTDLADMAQRSVRLNGLEERISIHNCDARQAAGQIGYGQTDLVVTNPPYLQKGDGLVSPDEHSAIARGGLDLALVDITLAQGDGLAVCAGAKAAGLAVIFLTASGDENSVVRGLDMGADDYISKPFRPRELVSRIRSVLRRTGRAQSEVRLGSVRVDTEKGVAQKNGKELSLSALEYRLLLALLAHRGSAVSRDTLLQELWDLSGEYVNDNTLTVYIKRLREKIEDDPQSPKLIRTLRGQGYQIARGD